jgi:hypothetical protein
VGERPESPLRDPAAIGGMLKEAAQLHLSYAVALIVSTAMRERIGNIDIMPSAIHDKSLPELTAALDFLAGQELLRVNRQLETAEISELSQTVMRRLENSLRDGTEDWKREMPGRAILRTFCSRYAKFDFGRFKNAYIQAARQSGASAFKELEDIFASFSGSSA